MQIAVIERNLSAIFDKLSRYELLLVTKESTTLNEVFYSNGIKVFRRNCRDIGFSQTFADTIIPKSYVDSVEERDNKFIIYCGEEKYIIEGIKLKSENPNIVLSDNIKFDELLNPELFDTKMQKKDNNILFSPVSLFKMGQLSAKQKTQIKKLLNEFIDGAQVKYQCCRIPAFSIQIFEEYYIIRCHIYNYAEDTYLSSTILYDSREDFNNSNPYKEYFEYAKSFGI